MSDATPQQNTDATEQQGDGLDQMTKDELYAEAQRLEIEGRSDMNKDELLEAVRGQQAAPGSTPPMTADGEISNPPVVPNQSAQDDT